MPLGSLRRLCSLSGLHARIGLAYFAYWMRSWFQTKDQREQQLVETHLRAAIKMLETMSYLRGAVAKAGQAIASMPEMVPDQFVETLGALHFQTPPMHYSLIREQLINELGADPEEIFDEFETEAIAAASLGQVHVARLKTGERVALKIQYPGIARTIRADMRNLAAIFAPLRLTKDWSSFKQQFNQVQSLLERETDYVRRGVEWMKRVAKHRRMKQQPVNVFFHKQIFQHSALGLRMRGRVNVKRLVAEEIRATGWEF